MADIIFGFGPTVILYAPLSSAVRYLKLESW